MNLTTRPPVTASPASPPPQAAIPHRLRGRLVALRVDAAESLHATDKSVVLAGRWHGKPIVVKLLVTDDPYWVQRFNDEQARYARLNVTPPPVRIARLLHAEEGLTILQRLPGTRLGNARYPDTVAADKVAQLLDTLDQLHSWRPGPGVLGDPQPITESQLVRHTASGQLTTADLTAVTGLLERMRRDGVGTRPEHGDVLAANVLAAVDGPAGLVDLEHLGRHTPGIDWALLYLLLGPGAPAVRPLVLQQVTRQEMQVPFALNLMLLACREWSIHHGWGGEPWETTRPTLRGNLEHARDYLHAIAAANGLHA